MKKFLVSLVFIVFAVCGMNAQNGPSEKGDSIVFNKFEHDYGTIERGGDGNCEFIFVNKGHSPLVLNNVRASCGCTVPKWPREPIPPGSQGVISVKYNPRISGAFNKSIIVNSNAENSTVRLFIKGKVVRKK